MYAVYEREAIVVNNTVKRAGRWYCFGLLKYANDARRLQHHNHKNLGIATQIRRIGA